MYMGKVSLDLFYAEIHGKEPHMAIVSLLAQQLMTILCHLLDKWLKGHSISLKRGLKNLLSKIK